MLENNINNMKLRLKYKLIIIKDGKNNIGEKRQSKSLA